MKDSSKEQGRLGREWKQTAEGLMGGHTLASSDHG